MQDINIFEELFLSTELWGYFGPIALVVMGLILIKKEKSLGIFWILLESLVIAHYYTLLEATPSYWWHIIILLLGVVVLTFQLIER